MATGPDEAGVLKTLIDWGWAAIMALVSVLYASNERRLKAHKDRMDNIEADMEEKADKTEMDRQRDNVAELFRNQAQLRSEMAQGFSEVGKAIHTMHVDLLDKINK